MKSEPRSLFRSTRPVAESSGVPKKHATPRKVASGSTPNSPDWEGAGVSARIAPPDESTTLNALAKRWNCSRSTIRRRETNLGLQRVNGPGNAVRYATPTPDQECLMIAILASQDRKAGAYETLMVPSPSMVVSAINAVAGEESKDLYLPAFQTIAFLLGCCLRCSDPELVIEVNAKRHERLVGKLHAAPVKKLLVKAGLIHMVRNYRVGCHCRAFRLDTGCFQGMREVRVPWSPAPSVAPSRRSKSTKAMPHSADCLARLESDIDRLAFREGFDAHQVAREHGEDKMRKIEVILERGRKRSKSKLPPSVRVEFAEKCVIDSARRFMDRTRRDLFPQERSWRVYHPVACMPSRLRNELRFDGQFLTCIDITSSQPYFLGLLFHDQPEDRALDRGEVHDYLELARGGKFYEWFMLKLGIDEEHRKEFKAILFRDLFFGKHCWATEVFKIFDSRFPNLGRCIKELHRSPESLAMKLQQMEAETIYGKVLPALQAAFPLVPIVTIHDAILVPSSIARAAEKVILIHFPPLHPPTLHHTHLTTLQ
jgi:hypothetical protein